jgi:hypothetical protein
VIPPGTRIECDERHVGIRDCDGGALACWTDRYAWLEVLAESWARHRARSAPFAEEAAKARRLMEGR